MAVYTPRSFVAPDEPAIRRVLDEYGFATLVTAGAGEPQITHLPLIHRDGALWGHMARANPHWQQFGAGHSVAIFHGPHAYVSPQWYAAPADQVPTWNFVVVHVHGRPEVLDDARIEPLLMELAARYDSTLPDAASVQTRRHGIKAFRMAVSRIDAKFKLNQNKTAADRAGVIEALHARGEHAAADWMQAYGAA